MKRLSILVMVCLLGMVMSLPSSAENQAKFEKIQAKMEKIFSSLQKMEKADLGVQEFFDPSNLFEYINGAADAYHQYDFVGLGVQNLKVGDIEIIVDMYDMGTPLNAFGIYSTERSPAYDFVKVGTQGYISDYGLNFLHDHYYVKISSFGDTEKTKPLMMDAAKLVAKAIDKKQTFPRIFQKFPKVNRVSNSEKYLKSSPLGLSFLDTAYTAAYKFDDKNSILALAVADNPEKSRAWLDQFKEHATSRLRAKINDVSDLGQKAVLSESQYEGEMLFVVDGKHVVIMQNPPQGYKKIISDFIDSL